MENSIIKNKISLEQVDLAMTTCFKELVNPLSKDIPSISKSESDLDGWDYCYAIAIGMTSVILSTDKKLEKYLAEIHSAANESSGEYDFFQKALGKLLHHKGDNIDIFKTRDGGNPDGFFHRLFWGHDIFSIEKDNPFALMIEQKGVLGGILQAVRHLIADTMSKQGLPIPGSSFFDYKNEKGKISNYILDIATQLSSNGFGTKNHRQEIYQHIATVRAQDITGSVAVKLLIDIYLKARNINDNIRSTQIRLVSYAISFFGEFIYGCVKQESAPYINMTLGVLLLSTYVKFIYINSMEITELEEQTERLLLMSAKLVAEQEKRELLIPKVNTVDELISSLVTSENNLDKLFDFLGESADEGSN